jgi:hypothetical protein
MAQKSSLTLIVFYSISQIFETFSEKRFGNFGPISAKFRTLTVFLIFGDFLKKVSHQPSHPS